MQITKEMLQKQLDTVKANTDGFIQGYAQALAFVNQALEAKEAEIPVESGK